MVCHEIALTFNFWNRSPFTRHNRDSMNKPYEPYMPDTDISFVSSGRTSVDRLFPSFYENLESGLTTPRLSTSSDYDFGNFGSSLSGNKQLDMLHSQFDHYSSSSSESGKLSSSSSSQNIVRQLVHESCTVSFTNKIR